MTAENKTILKNEDGVYKEDGEVDSGSNDIDPGMLVERHGNSDYAVNTTTNQENPEKRVARAHKEIGHETSDGNDAYTSGDHVKVARLTEGVEVELILASGADLGASSEANISKGDRLVTAGGANDGAVKQYDSANDNSSEVFAVAQEAVDNSSASSGSTARIEAEVL